MKSKIQTQKETIEYDAAFLRDWNDWCDKKGLVKRQASHAARQLFMTISAEKRQAAMEAAPATDKRRVKETVEYDGEFFSRWNEFCDAQGVKKRRAARACRQLFMTLPTDAREKLLAEVSPIVLRSRTRRANRSASRAA